MEARVVDHRSVVGGNAWISCSQVEQIFPVFDPLLHWPVAMVNLSEGCVDIGVATGPGEVDRGHDGVGLGASAVGSIFAGDPQFRLAAESVPQEMPQKTGRGTGFWLDTQPRLDAIGGSDHDRLEKSTGQIQRFSDFEISFHTLNS